MKNDNIIKGFFPLLRSGLWEKEVRLSEYKTIDYSAIMQFAEAQSVVGLITAGLEHVVDMKVPQRQVMQYVAGIVQIEMRNKALNEFVARLIERLQKEGVYCVLMKGQGIAQCYVKPLWRTCGDIDLLLDDENYKKAKCYLSSIATEQFEELQDEKHIEYTIDSWSVELHGNMPSLLSSKIDKLLLEIQNELFQNKHTHVWKNGDKNIYLPDVDSNVFFVFTHILKHFFYGGVGLRQICDWCRLLWTYKDTLNIKLLGNRLRVSGLMTEWKAFASLAVDTLGMPPNAMPFFSNDKKWEKKADKILNCIIKTGNFGHNKDYSYQKQHFFFIRKVISLWMHTNDFLIQFRIFPKDSLNVFRMKIFYGLRDLKKVIRK